MGAMRAAACRGTLPMLERREAPQPRVRLGLAHQPLRHLPPRRDRSVVRQSIGLWAPLTAADGDGVAKVVCVPVTHPSGTRVGAVCGSCAQCRGGELQPSRRGPVSTCGAERPAGGSVD